MLDPSPLKRPELRQRIGVGWLGVIHAAGQGPDGTPLAVRTLAPERLADVGRLAQLLSFAAQHEHQHILPVTLPGTEGSEVFYLMPQAVGGSLRGVFERYRAAGAKVDADTMLDVVRQVALGLDFAHSHGVLHGNLKPENVLLQPLPAPQQDEFRLLLSDFGLNSLRKPDPLSPYLPAPQRSGAATTLETDLYGLGALLFEGVTGQPLPPQPLAADLVNLPEPLAKIVARCVGFNAPFADVSAFLGYLRALQLAAQVEPEAVHLSADHSYLDIVPGESQEVRLKLTGESHSGVQLLVEGLPPAWTPTIPPVVLQDGKETVVNVAFQVPRRSSVRAGVHEASIVALTDLNSQEGTQRVEVGRVPLQLRVQPFDASQLRLTTPQTVVGQAVMLTATLRNEGNQTQRYNLEVNLPAGATARKGSARRQLELSPGAEFSEILDVRLAAAGLSRRMLTFTALANSVPRPTSAEIADQLQPPEVWPPVFNTVQDHLNVEQRPLVPWWGLVLGVAGLLGAGAWAARPPHIETFTLEGKTPMQGERFTLSWRTSGARQVQIAELPGQTVDTDGQLHLPGLNAPKTYTLVASGLLTQKKQQLTVTPTLPAPRIETFKVTPVQARLGETVQITWNVLHAQKVNLQPFGVVPASGTREFVMKRDTTVRLNAQKGTSPSGQDISSTQAVTLTPPEIKVFSLTPGNVMRGENVTVRWNVTGASLVRMNPLGELPPSGTRTFPATQTMNYTLKATNGQQEKTASASLTVRIPQARVEAMTLTPSSPLVGQPVKVQWRTQDASRAELRWGDQRQVVSPSGSFTITAEQNLQAVTLVAENANGVPAMETRRVQVRIPPPPENVQTSSNPAPALTPALTPAPTPGALADHTSQGTPARQPEPVDPTTPSSAVRPPVRSSPASVQVQPEPVRPQAPTTKPSTPQSPKPQTQKPQSSSPKPPPPAPVTPVQVQAFTYRAARQAGTRSTLTWKVTGTSRVRISGLTGPNADGSFPASGTTPLPNSARPVTYTLTAGNGKVRATVKVPAIPATATRPPASTNSGATNRPATTPATQDASTPGISGTWNHSYGQMNLQVSGHRVTGSLLSSRADLPSGNLRGTLSGTDSSPTLNAFVTGKGEQVALIVRFDVAAHTFNGLYSSRSARVPWCGWKSPAVNPCP